MLTPPTMEQLHALKLTALAAAWTAQQQDAQASALSFDERFGLLVDAEWLARENARLRRALKTAKLKLSQACLEALDYPARRELDKALIRQLATGRWIAEHHHLLITGATGTGKTFVACALAHQACRQGYRALYWRVSPALPCPGVGSRGWDVRPAPGQAGPGGRPGLGRSRLGAPPGRRTARSPRGARGSVRHPLDDRHQPGAPEPLA